MLQAALQSICSSRNCHVRSTPPLIQTYRIFDNDPMYYIKRPTKRINQSGMKFDGVLTCTAWGRAYCLRNGILTQITRDHSFVEEALQSGTLTPLEASNHPMRHVLTRAVGAESHVETDITVYPLLPDDLLLLCTDGLTKMIDDHDIRRILLQPATSLLDIARALIKEANGHGGADNITVVLARNELTTSRQER
jgi:serine/threonine protein phosphatase PrpC